MLQPGFTDRFHHPLLWGQAFQYTQDNRPSCPSPAGSQQRCWLTWPLQRFSPQHAHVFLKAGSHQASWLRASECRHSAFAKSLCINIKHTNSLCAALAELGILMLPNRSNILLCFSGSKANSRAPLKANSLYNQDNYCHVDTEEKMILSQLAPWSSYSLKTDFLPVTVTIMGINIISPFFLLAGYFNTQKNWTLKCLRSGEESKRKHIKLSA